MSIRAVGAGFKVRSCYRTSPVLPTERRRRVGRSGDGGKGGKQMGTGISFGRLTAAIPVRGRPEAMKPSATSLNSVISSSVNE